MTTVTDVFLYYPNLIGYSRVILMLLSVFFFKSHPVVCVVCYFLAFFGDLVDGHVARAFKQCSKFGAVLDMVTDRVSTASFVAMLAVADPNNAVYFVLLVALDIFSHWTHVASMQSGQHHKAATSLKKRNYILQCYYGCYPLFAFCCVGAEMFYILYYVRMNLNQFVSRDSEYYENAVKLINILVNYVCAPACAVKQFINFIQWWSAAYSLCEDDCEEAEKTK